MSLSDLVLLAFISILLLYAIYDEIIIDQRKGKTLLKISLLRRARADGFIFCGLVLIVLWQNISTHGAMITNWLLSVLAVLAFYLSGLRQPKILFKQQGFFFNSLWYEYRRIRTMNLSKDGVLLIGLEKRQLLIRVKRIDDLENIYQFLVNTQ